MWEKIILFISVCLLACSFLNKKLCFSEPNKFRYHLNFAIFYLACSLVALFLLPFFMLRPRSVMNCKFGASILKHVTKLYDVKWELRNGEILSEDRGAVIVSNHQSSLDILGLYNIWDAIDKLAIISKREVLYVFPFGLAAYLGGVIFINRSNPKKAKEQLQITTDVMVNKKTKIWLFPEGTRNENNRTLLPFKKGAFHTAVAAQVPIIPAVFSPYYFLNKKKGIFNRGHVIIKCLEPIPTKGLGPDDVEQLTNQVRDIMLAAYKELCKEVSANLPHDNEQTFCG